MNLKTKKKLAARKLGVGINKIKFDSDNLADIKEAITSLDIHDLKRNNIISIKQKKGRKTNKKRKTKIRDGKIKKKLKTRKRDYVNLTRKLRKHLVSLKKQGKLDHEETLIIRKRIKSKSFRSKDHMKDLLAKEYGLLADKKPEVKKAIRKK